MRWLKSLALVVGPLLRLSVEPVASHRIRRIPHGVELGQRIAITFAARLFPQSGVRLIARAA